jgi:hypothetical protein
MMSDEFDGVGAFDACFDSLDQASKFVGSGVQPDIASVGVGYELSVFLC